MQALIPAVMLLPVQSLPARLELPAPLELRVPLLLGQPKQHQLAPPPEPQWLAQLKRERTVRLAHSAHRLYRAATRTLIRDRQAFRSVRDNYRPNLLKRLGWMKLLESMESRWRRQGEYSWSWLPAMNNWRMRTEMNWAAHSPMER